MVIFKNNSLDRNHFGRIIAFALAVTGFREATQTLDNPNDGHWEKAPVGSNLSWFFFTLDRVKRDG
jgi:hypothetical protein